MEAGVLLKGSPTLLCGVCIVPPERPEAANTVRCPQCQQEDSVDKALDDARHHATHLARRALEDRRLAEGDIVRTRTPSVMPVKNLRWISGLAS